MKVGKHPRENFFEKKKKEKTQIVPIFITIVGTIFFFLLWTTPSIVDNLLDLLNWITSLLGSTVEPPKLPEEISSLKDQATPSIVDKLLDLLDWITSFLGSTVELPKSPEEISSEDAQVVQVETDSVVADYAQEVQVETDSIVAEENPEKKFGHRKSFHRKSFPLKLPVFLEENNINHKKKENLNEDLENINYIARDFALEGHKKKSSVVFTELKENFYKEKNETSEDEALEESGNEVEDESFEAYVNMINTGSEKPFFNTAFLDEELVRDTEIIDTTETQGVRDTEITDTTETQGVERGHDNLFYNGFIDDFNAGLDEDRTETQGVRNTEITDTTETQGVRDTEITDTTETQGVERGHDNLFYNGFIDDFNAGLDEDRTETQGVRNTEITDTTETQGVRDTEITDTTETQGVERGHDNHKAFPNDYNGRLDEDFKAFPGDFKVFPDDFDGKLDEDRYAFEIPAENEEKTSEQGFIKPCFFSEDFESGNSKKDKDTDMEELVDDMLSRAVPRR